MLDQVLPRVIADEGKLVLHAALVERDGRLILLVGGTGVGKSTLAAGMAANGFRLVGDDAAIVGHDGSRHWASATYPSLRLYPDSIEALDLERRAGSAMAEYSSKRHVALSDAPNEPDHFAIGAILFLERQAGSTESIAMRPVPAGDGCRMLLEQSFALDPTDTDQARSRLSAIAELANAVPMLRLSYPGRYGLIPAICAAVADRLCTPAH